MALPFYIYNKQKYGDICQRQTNKCHSAKSRAAAENEVYVNADLTGNYVNGVQKDFCNGISIGGCYETRLNYNKVSSIKPVEDWNSWQISGFRIAASPGSWLYSNEASKIGNHPLTLEPLEIGDPFEFLGFTPSAFYCNFLQNSTSRGLYLGGAPIDGININGLIIGKQGGINNISSIPYQAFDNLWSPLNGSLHTDYNNVDGYLNRFYMTYPTDGVFYRKGAELNTPTYIGYNSSPYSFQSIELPPASWNPCNLGGNGGDMNPDKIALYADIATENIANLGGFEEGRYLGKEYLYAQIKDEPQLMNYLALANFKLLQDGENLKYIDEIKRGLEYPIDTAKVNELFGKLNNIAPNIINEELYKRVFELALNNPEMEDQKYTDEQLEQLRDIALRCPFTEGNAVYIARVILRGLFPDENFYNYCDFAKNPKRENAERHATNGNNDATPNLSFKTFSNYQIVPNPNTGSFSLQCPDESAVTLTIYDARGNKVFENNATPNKNIVNIDVKSLANGIYSLIITNNTNNRHTVKFNIIN